MKRMTLFLALVATAVLSSAVPLQSPAPNFKLESLRKETKTLASYRNKVILVNFWASWCGPCQVELPALRKLAAEYRGRLRVVCINVDTDRVAAKRVIHKFGLDTAHLDVLWDTRNKVVAAYNISTMPTSYLLDGRGIVRKRYDGFHSEDPARWRSDIDPLLR